MPISLHSHSGQFCQHASGSLADVVQAAIDRSFLTYGLSEHMPRSRPSELYPEEEHMTPGELSVQFDRFVHEACRLKHLHRSQISILVGLETELIDRTVTFDLLDLVLSSHRASVEYLVGSVHHVNQIPIDFDRLTFDHALGSFSGSNRDEQLHQLCRAYFDAQHALMEKYHPEVIGHFDLCLLFHPNFDLQADASTWQRVVRNVSLAISYGALFEVNSAAVAKGWKTPYPSLPILNLIVSLGGRLTISDDSHGPDRVGLHYNELFTYLKENNVKKLWYLAPCEEGLGMPPRKRVIPCTVNGDWHEHPFWATILTSAATNAP